MKGPTEINYFMHDGGQIFFRSLRRELNLLLSLFPSDGATVECSTLVSK